MFLSTDSSKGDTMDISSEIPVTTVTFASNSECLFPPKSKFTKSDDSPNVFASPNPHKKNFPYSVEVPEKPSFSPFGKPPSFSFAGTAAKASEKLCAFPAEFTKTPTTFPKVTISETTITTKSPSFAEMSVHPGFAPLKKSSDFPLQPSIGEKNSGEMFVPHQSVSAAEKSISLSDALGIKRPIDKNVLGIFSSVGKNIMKSDRVSSFPLSGVLGNKVAPGSTFESSRSFDTAFIPHNAVPPRVEKGNLFLAAETPGNIASSTSTLPIPSTVSFDVFAPTKTIHSRVEKANKFSFIEAAGNQTVKEVFPQVDKGPETSMSSMKVDLSKLEKTQLFPFTNAVKEEGDLTESSILRLEKLSDQSKSMTSTSQSLVKGHEKALVSTRKPQKSKRFLSPEEVQLKTSIVCKGIALDVNTKDILSKHFSQFGDIQKITCNREKNYAIVRFGSHKAAALAKHKGSLISPLLKSVDIFWPRKSSKQIEGKKTSSELDKELQSMMEIEAPVLLNRPQEKLVTSLPLNVIAKLMHKKRDTKSYESTAPPKSSKLGDSTEESLRKIIENAAQTPGEKHRALDARDKLMRLKLQKQSDISTAKAVIGRCPDMCSEKERYSRFEKNCLSIFELRKTFDPKVTVKSLEHILIVKEYSRSSADQEEPLPHEIRPPHVLMMTMDYIMCNIANRSHDSTTSVGEWYDFIWNRTRAIRKDITQQDLCNVYCVELVEKCARFHIHCAAVLCEEDMATFDSKINDENLTKSLQTLKHLYHDLSIKGVKCPNEPEFRAYDILLSLNEGDALRHAQTLSGDIRNSPEVRFAVSAALSLSSNNYVRFFKLVLEASYLMSCVMHRYFTQVRCKAIRAILKAYCLPNHIEQYPLQDLVSFLKFENVSDASQFCQWLGFDTDESYVPLDRVAFAIPASSTLITRAVTLVESKRKGSVGEVMNNGPLPVNPLEFYKPHNSFDDRGYLTKEAFDALDQCSKIYLHEKAEDCVSKQPLLGTVESFEEDETLIDHSPSENIIPKEPNSQLSCEPCPIAYNCNLPILVENIIALESSTSANYSAENIINPDALTECVNMDSALCKAPCGNFVPEILPLTPNKMQEGSVENVSVVSQVLAATPSAPRLDVKERMRFAYDVQHNLLSEVVNDDIKKIACSEISASESVDAIYESLVNSVSAYLTRDICSDVLKLEVEKMAETKKKAFEMQQRRDKAAIDIEQELIKEIVAEFVLNIARSTYREMKRQTMNHISKSVLALTLQEGVSEALVSLVTEIRDKEREKWENCIRIARRKTELQRARKVLVKWERACIARRKLEACRNTFPSNPAFSSTEKNENTFAHTFESFQSIILNKHKVFQMLEAAVLYNVIKEEVSWYPLDLSQIFENNFNRRKNFAPMLHCWKLILFIPVKENDNNWTFAASWLCAKFGKGYIKPDFEPDTKLCSLYFLPHNSNDEISICVRAFFIGSDDFSTNLERITKNGYLEGSTAAILLMPQCEKDYMTKIFRHLEQLLSVKSPIPSLPLYCFITDQNGSDDLEDQNKFLNNLKRVKYIHDYKISHLNIISRSLEASGKLLNAVEWLLCTQSTIPDISHTHLKDFVEDCLIQIFNVVYYDLTHMKQEDKFQNPSVIVNFYNAVMKHWMQAASSADLMNISWPPPEITKDALNSVALDFGWNSMEYLNKIKTVLSGLILPEFHGSSASVEDMWIYVKDVITLGCKNACKLYSSIADVFSKALYSEMGKCCIPWAEIIYECAHYLMSCQYFIDESTDKEMEVNYITEELQNFDYNSYWKYLTNETDFSITNGSKKRRFSIDYMDEPLENRQVKLQCTPHNFENSIEWSLGSAGSLYHFKSRKQKRSSLSKTSDKNIDLYLDPVLSGDIEVHMETSVADPTVVSTKSAVQFEAEEISLELMKALESEKNETDAYISGLESCVSNGEHVVQDIFLHSFGECSMDISNSLDLPSLNFSGANKSLFEPDLQERILGLNESIEAQHAANKLFDKRMQALTFTNF